jgi:hypothetical protein
MTNSISKIREGVIGLRDTQMPTAVTSSYSITPFFKAFRNDIPGSRPPI